MSPAFKPTAEQRESVELMISYGAPETEICLLIKNPETGKPIEVENLREHLLPHPAGLNDPDRPVEAVEMVKDLAEAFCPVGELRTGDPVEPAPEIGRAHNRCPDSGLVGAARPLAAPSKPRS